MSYEIDSAQVIRLILQFCKEQNMMRTVHTLQEESRVTLDTVDSLERFLSDVYHGRWPEVLQIVGTMSIDESIVQDLYEQVVLELIEAKEDGCARQLLRETSALQSLKLSHPDRFKRLEHLCSKGYFDAKEVYEGVTREKKRARLGEALAAELQEAPPSRLLHLLTQSLKYQQRQGLLPPGQKFDLFRGISAASKLEPEAFPQQIAKAIVFGKTSHPECAAFSPDGQYLVSGSVDGFIEIWDTNTGTLRKDLEYQATNNFMLHEVAVMSIGFSKDSELLATGAQDGKVKVWRLSTGHCVKKFERAHNLAIASVQFSRDSTNLLTASFDYTARIHGLKSGKTIREFRGHNSYVNSAIYSSDGSKVITASSDGKVKVWDSRTTEEIYSFSPPPPPYLNASSTPSVNMVFPAAKAQSDLIFVCTKTSTVYLANLQGQILSTFSTGKREGGDFVFSCSSPRGEWVYALGEDNNLYVFSSAGKLEHFMKVHEKDAIGVVHHPHQNMLASWGFDGSLNILKP